MRHQIHDLLAPVPGTARQIHSFHFGPEQAQGKIYIQSSLHADEMPGMLVAWHLKQRLAELEAAGRLRSEIVLVPVANPVGLEQVLMDRWAATSWKAGRISTAGSSTSAKKSATTSRADWAMTRSTTLN
jgi:predicted deacylase